MTGAAGLRMIRALGPSDVVVNVREPGEYEYWHGRDGLRCMNCNASVHVMQRQNGSRWMRHSAADKQRCAAAAASGPEGPRGVKIPMGKLVKTSDCQVDLIFTDVSGDAKMYVLALPDNKGWKFRPSEISPGPTVIDIATNLANAPQPL